MRPSRRSRPSSDLRPSRLSSTPNRTWPTCIQTTKFPWASTSLFGGQRLERQHWEGELIKLYEGRHPLSILSSFFMDLMLMYSSEAQSLVIIRKIDKQSQQDVVVPFYDPRNGLAFRITLCAPRASRSPIGKKDERMERIITPCGAGLKAGGWELKKWVQAPVELPPSHSSHFGNAETTD